MRGQPPRLTDPGSRRDPSPDGSALRVVTGPAGADAAVLVLHGGREHGRRPARPWQPAAVRMRPFLRAVDRAVPDRRLFVGTVRYRYQGWNGTLADPLRDTERALAELARRAGEVPVVLIGHSMGGRAALRAAADPRVAGVVALAPWCPEGEPVAQLRGGTVVILHGDRDRTTDPDASLDLVRRARVDGARAGTLLITGGDHAMLRRGGVWHRTAGAAVAEILAPDGATGSGLIADTLASALPVRI
ncbi:alpha/beta fold hydrolase [Streptomyces sp. NA02950]|uniref:alpha/beta hydrolase n=1 Tax=Streptomyces sp. NA02950 TaxID=2742137 RepID=UPI001591F644|nr:alpha/beta fold hydrolase [Streptomyces sp. NA02950]QKV96385.1 alpha/beta fold hydrolase [Streptomyces sp. NA02950]